MVAHCRFNYDRRAGSIILGETWKIHVKQAGVTRRSSETVESYRRIVVCYWIFRGYERFVPANYLIGGCTYLRGWLPSCRKSRFSFHRESKPELFFNSFNYTRDIGHWRHSEIKLCFSFLHSNWYLENLGLTVESID